MDAGYPRFPHRERLHLIATAQDPDNYRLSYAWSAPSGEFSETDEAGGSSKRFTATGPFGRVTVRVMVTDGGETASASVVVEVENQMLMSQ